MFLPGEMNKPFRSTKKTSSTDIRISTSELHECDHLTMSDAIKSFSTGLTNLRCHPFPVQGHWLPSL